MSVEMAPKTNVHVVFTTARGRNAEQAGRTGGLIGMIVGKSIGAREESQGREMVTGWHGDSGHFEVQIVSQEVTNRLIRSGIRLSSAEDVDNRLVLNVTSVGLQEAQRGFWVAYLAVCAKLRKPDGGNLWSAVAKSTATKPRRVEEFTSNPEIYRDDLREAAEDVARQLVEGPIRR